MQKEKQNKIYETVFNLQEIEITSSARLRVDTELANLPESLKRPVYAYFYNDESCQSIAKTMNCSVSTVKRNLAKAIFHLKKECNPEAFKISETILSRHLPNTVKF